MLSFLKKRDTDMTQGSIPKLLIEYALPLLVGNIFQQLYNAVDSIVVGNFVGTQALAAVGCTTPVVNMLIGIFNGLALGGGVVISQYYGAKDDERLSRAVQTTVLLTLIVSVVSTLLGVFMTPYMLKFMDAPADVFPQAEEYLKIYFWGISGLMFYNIGAAMLRAVGDSTRPLYYLMFCCALNTVLDLYMVRSLGMGIAGAAIATIISQFVSAILVFLMLIRSRASYRVRLNKLSLDRSITKTICVIGVPSSLQMGVTAFSNVFVLSYINRFASACLAGWTAYLKLDAFVLQPIMSLGIALTTFVGQNMGAGRMDRVKQAPRWGAIIGISLFVVLTVPLMVFAPQLTSLFNQDPEVLRYGTLFVRMISPFYLFVVADQIFSGILRGMGDTKPTMIIMLACFVVFRQIYLYVASLLGGGIYAISLGYPAGWITCATCLMLYYFFGNWEKKLRRI